jgi:hypothetical protein
MFLFMGKLLAANTVAFMLGLVVGLVSDAPATGVAAYLLFMLCFQKVIFR